MVRRDDQKFFSFLQKPAEKCKWKANDGIPFMETASFRNPNFFLLVAADIAFSGN